MRNGFFVFCLLLERGYFCHVFIHSFLSADYYVVSDMAILSPAHSSWSSICTEFVRTTVLHRVGISHLRSQTRLPSQYHPYSPGLSRSSSSPVPRFLSSLQYASRWCACLPFSPVLCTSSLRDKSAVRAIDIAPHQIARSDCH